MDSGTLPYLAAGMLLTWAVLLGYAWRLEVRLSRARRRLDRVRSGAGRSSSMSASSASASSGESSSSSSGGAS